MVLKAENDDKKNYPNQIYDNIIIQGVAEHVLKKLWGNLWIMQIELKN